MANHRPSTLKLWRFFLDVCDVLEDKTGFTSSHDIAAILQARYNTMSSEAKKLHFGLDLEGVADPRDTFPAQATVLRYLDWIEEDLTAFLPRKRLIPRAGSGERASLGRPDAEGVRMVRDIGSALFRHLRNLSEEKHPLMLAMSDSVSSFLLPRVAVTAKIGKKFQPKTRKFTPADVIHALTSGHVDAAVGWLKGYHQDVPEHPEIEGRTLEGSECPVCVLFSPLQEGLGQKKLDYIDAHPTDPEAAGFTLTPDDLRGTQLIHPDLPQLARIVDGFEQRELAEGYQIDHFASVLSAVRANNGVGLFFGFPWLLREIEHQHRVYSATLAVPPDWGVDLTMRLRAYTRKGDTSPVTGEATRAANNLVNALEEMLVHHGFPPPTLKPEWRLAGPAAVDKGTFKKGAHWHVAFVTSGRFDKVVSPRWKTGRIEFDAPAKDGRPRGVLFLAKDESAKFMDVWADPDALAEGTLVLRFKRLGSGAALGTHTAAYFPSRIAHPGFDGTCLVGSLSFAVSGRPFCSPILLSDQQLADSEGGVREACKSVARSHVLDFLFGDEPGA
jgi:hypothetical protein